MLIPVRPPFLLRMFYPGMLWRREVQHREVFLTFDDGPTPGVTEFVLDTLRKFSASGTFFCIGKNVNENPGLYKRITVEGHRVGNHTYNHFNGWDTPDDVYIEDIRKSELLIESGLFRPPYGRIRKSQAKHLIGKYEIVMWDVLSFDYHSSVNPEKCLSNVIQNVRPGSIVVFHDSEKASEKLVYALPRFMEHLQQEGYTCSAL